MQPYEAAISLYDFLTTNSYCKQYSSFIVYRVAYMCFNGVFDAQ